MGGTEQLDQCDQRARQVAAAIVELRTEIDRVELSRNDLVKQLADAQAENERLRAELGERVVRRAALAELSALAATSPSDALLPRR